ncbi:50S ribosomal protein L1 [Pyrobaculum aerophilum]|uniref:Large ribosomal subunit protein uL1 n=2 Tax=Pyrobaculum aerophilum TaxID=13773 RepID=RL1_PYRAE|nr:MULTISPECIES: 50S ribosomal protein L1 [Pyrobaculum]Q8ZTT4.1 RecName: Full=Large ribosomal subunit protein uL1; AltName: Full=50S ribosomal protein L1 [Pyrobaculum aerophilum str. IM2]AAL64675.1 ribosomal protein L1 [Pyrobaculum aerophilum str. IM2]MCX8136531.1 50S ribosomal protein L1 [Pyrobaculum aerophilum]RFA95772.1 50S ribosomal protein L1 [Pyrobaculum aerophilum]HII46194.1 50S ribosomal protein L1 [Pyrobaculum aerophilum]
MSAVINKETLQAKIAEALKAGKPRRFKQSVELIVVLKGVDLSKPENRINLLVELPHPPKPNKIAAFAHGAFEVSAKNAGVDSIITRDQVEGLSGNKRAIRKLAKQYDFFIAPPDLMPLLGRVVGPIFGPRGKMPEVVPPNVDVKSVVERLRKAVRVRFRNEPVVKVRIGSEGQSPKEILENALVVLEEVNRKFPLRQYLKDLYFKKTMGPPVKVRAVEALVK